MDEILKYAIENGMIDIAQMKNEIEMKKRDELLSKHQYKVWEGTNGYWYTYLPDKDKGRILKKKKSRKDIEDVIIGYLKDEEDNPTLEEVFNAMNDEKFKDGRIRESSHIEYKRVFLRHFQGIKNKRIKTFNSDNIQDFIYERISEDKMFRSKFSYIKFMISEIFRYAKRKRYVNFYIRDVIDDLDIPLGMTKTPKRDTEEVFAKSEVELIHEYVMNNSNHVVDYGILLGFHTGLRVGEMCVLKWSDIHDNYISVTKTLTRDLNGVRVIGGTTKTESGVRDVIIPASAIPIIDKLRELSRGDEYVFTNRSNGFYKDSMFSVRLVQLCEEVGIKYRSFHKIRKTYASILLDAKMDNRFITEQMGHRNILITENVYHKNRKTIAEKTELLNSISDFYQ